MSTTFEVRPAVGAPEYPPPTALDRVLDLLFPPVCVGCRRIGRWICSECWTRTPWFVEHRCFECGSPSTTTPCLSCGGTSSPLGGIVAVAEFDGIAREAVHALKYHGRHAIGAMMGRLMAGAAGSSEVDGVIAVPLHPSRRRQRGYDQSAILARAVAREGGMPVRSRVLRRARATRQQASLGARERRENVRDAFAVDGTVALGHVLLVDDVITTGATMEAAAAALRHAGVQRVTGLVFADAR